MDPAALILIPFLMAASANEAALAQQRYAAAVQQGQQPAVYAVPPVSGRAPAAPMGRATGHAATTPPAYVVPQGQPVYVPGYVYGADFMAPYGIR